METKARSTTSSSGEAAAVVASPGSLAEATLPARSSAPNEGTTNLRPPQSPETKPTRRILAGMFLISLGAMMVEIALTRVFSLVLYYHFAFLVIGVAMLGLGTGGLLEWRQTRRHRLGGRAPAYWAVLSGLSVAILASLPSLELVAGNILIYTVIAAIAFAMVGATAASILARFSVSSGRIYAADLAGAAVAALLAVPLLAMGGAINTLLASAAIMAWGSWALRAGNTNSAPSGLDGTATPDRHAFCAKPAFLRSQTFVVPAMAVVLTALALSNPGTGLLNLMPGAIDSSKTMIQELSSDGRVVFSRWDAFARTDVVATTRQEDVKYVFLDGAAGAAMYRFDGDLSGPNPLRSDLGYFPFLNRAAGDVLDIGPGGGRDVLLALLGGASQVTAVEVNPGAVEAVRRFADFNGAIYDRPDVEVVVDEGRGYLKRSTRRYDTIYLSLAMTQSAERVGFALAENYLYTVEAFRDYLDHLKPGGQLVLKVHDDVDLERVVRTARRALEEGGTSPAEVPWHFLALSQAGMMEQHGSEIMYPLLVVRKDPYVPAEAERELQAALSSGFLPIYMEVAGGAGPLSVLGAPDTPQGGPPASTQMVLAPTTDDRPFFYLYGWGPPPVVVAVMVLALLVALVTWWRLRGSVPADARALRPSLAYFACLGVAFMLVEVTLIQKLTLFLGHPTIAVTVALFSILVSGAAGSWLASRWQNLRALRSVGAALAGTLAIAYTLLLEPLTASFFASPLEERVLVAVVLIAPIGISMGIPFPSGLRTLAHLSTGSSASLAWTANGLASVFGSASAVAVATVFGYSASLAVGGATYLAAAALGVVMARAVPVPSDTIDAAPIQSLAPMKSEPVLAGAVATSSENSEG